MFCFFRRGMFHLESTPRHFLRRAHFNERRLDGSTNTKLSIRFSLAGDGVCSRLGAVRPHFTFKLIVSLTRILKINIPRQIRPGEIYFKRMTTEPNRLERSISARSSDLHTTRHRNDYLRNTLSSHAPDTGEPANKVHTASIVLASKTSKE